MPTDEFIGEDDLDTFEGWLKYQGVDPTATPPEVAMWRALFDEAMAHSAATRKAGLMKLRTIPGEYRYAVAVPDGDDLWLTMWMRFSRKGEFFVLTPTSDGAWNPHTSYHLDGTWHMKIHDRPMLVQKRQPLIGPFRGAEPMGAYAGHSPKKVGANCDLSAFSGVVEVAPGILGPRHGDVLVDLIAPGEEPVSHPKRLVQQEVFRDVSPLIVIRIFASQ